jgi:hypothetical protein
MFFPIPPSLEDKEDPIIPLYCGLKNMKPSLNTPTYTLFKDLHERDFIFVYPCNLEVYPIWMGKVYSDVAKDGNDKHYRIWCTFKTSMVGALQEKRMQQCNFLQRLLARKVEMQLSKPNAMSGH